MSAELLVLSGLAAGLGGAAATSTGPLKLGWRAAKGVLRRRLLDLPGAEPAPWRQALGRVLIGAVLAGGAMTAYAAEPASPPVQAALRAAVLAGQSAQPAVRWVQTALTATAPAKASKTAPAAPALSSYGKPYWTKGGGKTDAQLLAQARATGFWDGQPKAGLNAAETQRYVVYGLRLTQARLAEVADAQARGIAQLPLVNLNDNLAQLGKDAPDYDTLLYRHLTAMRQDQVAANQRAQAAYDTFQREYGDVSIEVSNSPFTVISGADFAQLMQAQRAAMPYGPPIQPLDAPSPPARPAGSLAGLPPEIQAFASTHPLPEGLIWSFVPTQRSDGSMTVFAHPGGPSPLLLVFDENRVVNSLGRL